MIRSMTAFSRREDRSGGFTLAWEIRSVNHRYLEPSFRLPDNLRDIEPALREQLRRRLSRGKVECSLRLAGEEARAAGPIAINTPLLDELLAAVQAVALRTGQPVAVNPVDILRWPGVTQSAEADVQAMAAAAAALFETVLGDFIEAREREGRELADALALRLDGISREVERVRAALPQILDAQRARLRARVEEAVASPDRDRLEQELVLLAARMDVAEEMDRLVTHVQEVRRVLKEGGSVGRKLDFLMQELNREANTLGSKSVSADTTQASVEIKVLIEQMREQIQNIE